MSGTTLAPPPLSIRQQKFVDGILAGKEQHVAYKEAGYHVTNDDSAHASASRLMRETHIADALADARRQLRAMVMTDARDIIDEVDILATSDIGDVLDLTGEEPRLRPACEISERARKSIASVKVKRVLEKKPDAKGFREVEIIEFRFWSKPEALRIALQRRGLLEPAGREGEEKPCKVYLNFNPLDVLTGPQTAEVVQTTASPTLPPPDAPTSPGEAPPPS